MFKPGDLVKRYRLKDRAGAGFARQGLGIWVPGLVLAFKRSKGAWEYDVDEYYVLYEGTCDWVTDEFIMQSEFN